jgi:hypothetical protein
MPEKSRGRSAAKRGVKATGGDGPSQKNVTFEAEQMDLDERFEELKQPVYKGKKLDDPISSPVVQKPIGVIAVADWTGQMGAASCIFESQRTCEAAS